MKILILLPILLFASCSQVRLPSFSSNKKVNYSEGWQEYDEQDYFNHLASFEGMYLKTPNVSKLRLGAKADQYLNNLLFDILQNNELFFSVGSKPRIHIIESDFPFHFSLPGRVIFLSTVLVNKYIKHEAILVSILSYELIRSEKKLYNKLLIVPVGYLPIERVLGLNRIDVDSKIEIHKWAYYLMRRAGYDGEYYLSWLQMINRNTADFLPLLGDASSISREEAMFKAFIIRRAKIEDDRTIARRDSSKDFYSFLFNVKDKSI
jgi:hypothetical protein